MIDPLRAASTIAAGGLAAQSFRLQIVAENMANANSTGTTPGADPYARKTALFDAVYAAVATLEADGARGKRAVVAMTDGVDNSSRRRVDEVIERAREAKTRAEQLLKSKDPTVDYARAEDALQRAETRLSVAKEEKTFIVFQEWEIDNEKTSSTFVRAVRALLGISIDPRIGAGARAHDGSGHDADRRKLGRNSRSRRPAEEEDCGAHFRRAGRESKWHDRLP